MRAKSAIACVAVFLSGWACGLLFGWVWNPIAASGRGTPWHDNLDSACRLAAETNSLVLVHLGSDSCATCRRMQCNVLSRPDMAALIQAHFAPVENNVLRLPSAPPVAQIAVDPPAGSPQKGPPAATGPGPTVMPGPQGDAATPKQENAGVRTPATVQLQVRSATQDADLRGPIASPSNVPAENVGTGAPLVPPTEGPAIRSPLGAEAQLPPPRGSAPLADTQPASSTPPLALDGYCPVTLAQKKRWVKGDSRWGVNHRGQTYLFAGPEEARQFCANPESYAPVASGIDLVAAVERDQAVLGRREHGTWYGGHLYLFTSETTHQMFERYPERYTSAAPPTTAGPTAGNAIRRY